jgi:hypothetical protein
VLVVLFQEIDHCSETFFLILLSFFGFVHQWRSTTKIKTGPVSRKWVENKLFVADGPNLSQNLRESS